MTRFVYLIIEVEVSGSNGLQYDEEHALNFLLDAFGSVISLKDIASAYWDLSSIATSESNGEVMGKHWIHSAASNTSKGELEKDEPLESSSRNSLQNSCPANGDFKTLKQKWRPVSGGTVSLKDIACDSGEVNRNVDDAGQILFKMQGEVKNGETLESSRCNDSHNYYEVNGNFVAPKQIWRQVSAASITSNGELKMDEPLESSSSNSSQNSCPANGDLRTIKQKWRAVSGATVSLEDIASSYCEAKQNVDVAGEILFNMQGDPSLNATSASNSEAKNRKTLESSCSNHSQNYYRVSADFVAPKQIWRQVSAASNTSNGELKKDEPLESSSSNSFQSSCPTNGDLRTIKQKWRPVSGGTASLNDIASSYCEVKPNADVVGEIQFKMLGDPSFIANNASNGEAKNGEALGSSHASNSQNYYRVNGDFVAPKQILRQVSTASNTSNCELKMDQPLESSSSNSAQNSCPANGDLRTIKQKWRPVSGGTVSLNDTASYCEANRNVDAAGEILFKMQGVPSFIATSASNVEVKNGETLESSRCNDSQNHSRVNGDFVAPKQIWRQVSAASNTCNGERKKDEPLESSSSNSSQNSCPENGDSITIKQKWRPVSGGTVSLNDIASSYREVNRNVDVGGEILFKMQGDPSCIATSASNGEAKNGETLESSHANSSNKYYKVNVDFVAPKQIWRQVSAASSTSDDEMKRNEPLESSSNSLQNSCRANGEILFKMQGPPSFFASNASNGEAKNVETLESSHANNSQNYKQIWRQVSGASNTSNGELKKDEPLESSSSNSLQNSCPENGDLITIKQNWRPVSGGTVSLNDIASSCCEVNQNVDVGGEILFRMQGDPSCIATSASNGEAKNGETLESSHANSSQNYYKVNGDFVAPKQIWRQVSAASNTSNGELKKNEPLESSSSNSLQNSCPANGEILFKMQDPPSFIASNASNGEAKNVGTLESFRANNSQNHKQIWRQVSGASNTSNGELKKDDEPLESSSSNSLQNSCPENGDLRNLNKKWRPVSGGPIPLKDIASAYCEANWNVDVAGEILFKLQGEPSFISSSASNGEVKNGETKKDEPLESLNSNSSQNSCPANGNLRTLKQKWRPVSGGTVSNMLGKGYMKSAPSTNGSNPRTKPLKVESKEWPVSVLWGEHKSNSIKEDRLHKDMEDFLFKMLGVALQLGRDVISDVLDSCGYDMQKSMEKLLDRSAAGLDERSKFLGESNKKTNVKHPRAEEPSCENRSEVFEYQWRSKTTNGQKRDPKGELVEGPLVDSVVMAKVDTVGSQDKKDDEDEEDSFQALRRAVEEYRGTMKEYFKAATEAFAKGDQDLANRLVEQGQFYRGKARQADEESNQKIFDTWNMDTEYEMLLDLHDHGAREAICLLKCHLSSLAGIPCYEAIGEGINHLE
ncbi:hypothetical protein V6N11_048414 [Hibiscus sabdariffa]|uniref:DUF1771 domain-containing protein n=1 Tax=Hibiscus sabdariffa TaxID=183260 RepID=A0ABR2PV47_9ROSI